MRKVTMDAVNSFFNRSSGTFSNTTVDAHSDGLVTMKLHGNTIATMTRSGSVMLSTCGWETTTTKERLNGLLDHLGLPRVYTSKGVLMDWTGEPWNNSSILTSCN